MFLFEDAISMARNGTKVFRESWPSYEWVEKTGEYFIKYYQGKSTPYVPTQDDMNSKDWRQLQT